MAVLRRQGADSRRFFRVEVRFVDTHGHGDAEVGAELRHPREVVLSGRGGFHHGHSQIRAGKGADHRAAHAGRAVAEQPVQPALSGQFPRTGFEQRHQAAGIFRSGGQLGVHKGAQPGFAHIPLAAVPFGKGYGFVRAQAVADSAALAGQGVDLGHACFKVYGLKAAEGDALAAARAACRVHHGRVAGDERLFTDAARVQQNVQIGHIHIQVRERQAQPFCMGQGREGGAETGLARAPFAADDDDLRHERPP